MPPLRNYCTECEWIASSEGHSRDELGRLAIEHAVEFGHDIDSEQPPDINIENKILKTDK